MFPKPIYREKIVYDAPKIAHTVSNFYLRLSVFIFLKLYNTINNTVFDFIE